MIYTTKYWQHCYKKIFFETRYIRGIIVYHCRPIDLSTFSAYTLPSYYKVVFKFYEMIIFNSIDQRCGMIYNMLHGEQSSRNTIYLKSSFCRVKIKDFFVHITIQRSNRDHLVYEASLSGREMSDAAPGCLRNNKPGWCQQDDVFEDLVSARWIY